MELLARGLIDEISILICPYLVGGERHSSLFIPPEKSAGTANPRAASSADAVLNSAFNQKDKPDAPTSLKLMQMERLKGEAIWLRYEIV